MDDIIIQLQTKVAYQEEEVANLGSELFAQQKEIAELKKQVSELKDLLKAAAEEVDAPTDVSQEPPPPHY